jgi:PAS domain S-box-containing protein
LEPLAEIAGVVELSLGGQTTPLSRGARPESIDAEQARSSAAHLVQFYEQDEALAAAVARFVAEGLSAGEVVTTIATDAHTKAIDRHLQADGVDTNAARASGRFLSLDAHETLAKFMRDGQPSRELFDSVVGGVMSERGAVANGARLRAYGEMVDVLWKADQKSAALYLEELWNDLQAHRPFTLLCAYAMGQFYKEPALIHGVCATHTQIVGLQHDGEVGSPARAMSLPSHYAEALAREILHREEVELALRQSLRELRSKEEELRQSEEQLRDFVENGTIALHRVGADGRILWVNRAELDLLGYSAEEYVGRPIADFHVDQDVIADILARLGRGEVLHDCEARLRAKDGSIKDVLINSSGLFRDGKFVHSRCFTRDITERRKAEQALRDSERQLKLITDALPVCISYVDRDVRYRFVSAAYEQWFGRTKDEIVGRRVEDVIGAGAYQKVGPYIDRALAGEAVTYQGEVPYLDNGTRFVEATYIPQFDEGQRVVGMVALVSDISERKAFERFRATAAARVERLVRITGAVADAVTPDEVLSAVVDNVAAALSASSAALWLVEDDGRHAKLARAIGYPESASQGFNRLSLDSDPATPAIDAIRRSEPISIPSQAALLRDYPHLGTAVTPDRSYRIYCLPLVSRDRTLGALGITIDEPSDATDDEHDFLLLVARYAGQAIERLRLLDAERKSRTDADAAASRLSLLNQASRAFGDADLDLEARLRGVASELSKALDSSINIALIEPDGQLHLTAVHHPVAEAQKLLLELSRISPIRMGEGVTGTVAATGESVLIAKIDPRDVVARAPVHYRAFLERHPVYAMVGVPLRVHGRIIGTATAARCRGDQSFTPDDLKLLEELGERAAAAIENARLHREAVDARARAEQLYRFAQSVVAADRVEIVFDAAMAALETALGAKRAAILTFDADGVMRFRASRNLSETYRSAVEGHSPWARDAVAPQPVLVEDVGEDPSMTSYLPLFREEGIGSLAFIPLVTRGQLIGKFMVYYEAAHAYSQQEVELANAIAHHLASVTARFAAFATLEETIRYNNLFAGVLAHDLRNPLGAIMTAGQMVLMRSEGQGDRTAKPVSRIISSGQRMLRMIDQLLDVTRVRAGGGIQVEPRDTNLTDLCSQAIDEIELAFPQWTIERESLGDLDGVWDPDRLLQIISNLLSNAGQHGRPEGTVAVKLDGRDAQMVTLEVHNGGAIPEALLPMLFDPFRGSRQRPDASRGLGLGLYIVKEIAKAHGGSIDVSSSIAEGTTFVLSLPRRTVRSAGLDRQAP